MEESQRTNHHIEESGMISRRGLLATSLVAVGSLIGATPSFANVSGEDATVSGAAEAEQLWQEAVRRARAEGEFVSGYIPFSNKVVPSTSVKAAKLNTVIKGVPTVVTASTSLETNGLLVTKVNHAWITATAATVSNQGYRYTKADNGRTVCITYWCSITPAHKVPATCQFYAEFHSTGGGWMKGGAVS